MGLLRIENHEAAIDKTVDSKYVQQHLANERTFLAWIRTSIAIVGLGFLISQVVLHSSSYYTLLRIIANIIGLGSFILGTSVTLFATKDYVMKRKGINNETFHSPIFSIVLLSVILSLIIIVVSIVIGITLLNDGIR